MVRRHCLVTLAVLVAAPLGLAAPARPLQAQEAALPFVDRVTALTNGERAKATVAFLDQYVRWPGNRGFDASIAHIATELEAAGYVPEAQARRDAPLVYRVERYPMAQPAWEPLDASVVIEGDPTPLLRFATNRNMLATNSFATPADGVRAEVVSVGSGSAAEIEAAGDLRGKIVFANAAVGRVFTEAVVRRGALGVLGYALPAYLKPEVNRTSIQFASVPRDTVARAWGIALSFEARERLTAALARGPVRLRVHTDVRFTDNAVEQTVVAEVRGTTHAHERFVFSAHVQEPGANDNASGVGAQLEMARVSARLLAEGMPRPARTITYLWGLEIRSTDRFITQDSVRARDIKWGMSLDMVGEDTEKTGGTFLIEKMPDPSAIWTRGNDRHTEWGGRPLTKADLVPHYFNDYVHARALAHAATTNWVVNTNPFEGGSDHTPFLRAKKPGLLLWHFTDQFYHTDGDRLDKVSATTLRNVAIAALTSALPLVRGDAAAAQTIVREVRRAALARLDTEAALARGHLADATDAAADSVRAVETDILRTWALYYADALATITDVERDRPSDGVRRAIEEAQRAVHAAADRHLAATARPAPPTGARR
jgi:aminopeptidase YwaD